MNLYNVLLNNKIPFVLHESGDSENVIYCKSFSDYLFNVGTFTTRTKEVILEYVVDNAEKYVVADVTFDNGECYRDVRFKVVVNENTETPYSTINLNLLNNKTQVAIPQQSQQIVEDVEELVERPAPVYISAPIIEAPDYTETINETLKLQKKLNVEKEEIRKQKIVLEKQNLLNKKLQEYKQELLEEYVTAVDKQKQLLGAHLKETLTIAEHDLSERITNTFNEYSNQLEIYQNKSKADQLEFIIEKINDSIVDIKVDLNSLVSNKFNQEQDILLEALHAKSQLLQEKYGQKLLLELEKYKETLFEEFRLSSQEAIVQTLAQKKDLTEQQIIIAFDNKEKEFNSHFEARIKNTTLELDSIVQEFSNKLPVISDDISLLETKLKDLLEERKKSDETGKFNTSQQKYITDTAQYWARRILDLGGGGGSVAVQYANGGTMNGDLNVNANYLSGGVNLLDIFALQPDLDHQTLSFNESTAQLSISNGNTVSLSALSGEFTDRLVNGSYQVVLSGNGNLTLPGAIVTASNSKLDLVGFGPNTAYLTTTSDDSTALFMGAAVAELRANTYASITTNTGGTPHLWEFGTDGGLKFPDNTTQTTAFTGNPDSSNWDSTYTTVKNFSASWEESADIGAVADRVTNIQQVTGSWQRTYTNVSTNSANWQTGYNNAIYTVNGTVNQIISTPAGSNTGNNSVTLSLPSNLIVPNNLTVLGNLTALGTSTFTNTVFTTTSALSVVNLGPGPALYVFQAAGASDVASFYDGDGIEVLHVGNAQGGGNPLGKVGVNTSFPTAELTVNGAISSNGDVSVVNMQAFNAVGIGTYAPIYFNLDVSGPAGNGSIGSSHGDLSLGSTSNILINPNNNLLLGPVGNVGIGTTTPNEKLTVVGNISATGAITASGGNSNQWNSNYSTTQSNSANWNTAYTNLVSNSSNYLSGASVSYVNTNFVKISGDVMTGGLSATGLSSAFVQIFNKDVGAPALNPKLFIYDNSGIGYPELFTVQAADASDPLLRFKRTASNAGNYVFMVRGAPGATWMSINDNSYFDQQLIIHSNGNVGISQTAPTTKLHVNGVVTASGGNSNQWNTAYTNLVSNSSNYLSGASVSYVNTNFVKISGDTMTGTLSAPKIVLTSAGSSSSPAIILSGTSFNSGIYLTGDGDGIRINTRNNYTSLDISSLGVLSDRVIGTTSDGSAAFPSVYVGYETNSGLFRPAANNIGISIAGTERVRVNSSGLTVTGSVSATQGSVFAPSTFTAADTVTDAALIMDFTRGASTGGMYVRRSNGQQRSIFNYQDSAGNIDVGTFSNNINSVSIKAGGGNLTGFINFGTFSSNNAMRIIDNGNTGIGTTTPNEKLTVVGNISATGTIYTTTTAKAIATYIANIGNGVGTSFNLPHNLNTLEIITSVYDNTTNVQAYPTVTVVDANTVNVQFSFTPSTNAYRVVIVAATSTNLIAAYGGLTTTAVEKYQFRSSDFNITSSAYFAVDTTSGPVRATLPAAPSLGDTVIFIDTYKTWTANNLVLQRNGNVIESLAEDLSANISGFTFKATWVGAPAGWRIY